MKNILFIIAGLLLWIGIAAVSYGGYSYYLGGHTVSEDISTFPTAIWMSGESVQTTNDSGNSVEAIWQGGESVIRYK